MKKILILSIAILFCLFQSVNASEDLKVEKNLKETKKENIKYTVTYYYTNYRCATCRRIEEYSRKAVKKYFSEEIKSGKIEFRMVNTDEEENKKFLKHYKLFTKSLIISRLENNKEKEWKNLEKIWEYNSDEEKFLEYLKTEIKGFIK